MHRLHSFGDTDIVRFIFNGRGARQMEGLEEGLRMLDLFPGAGADRFFVPKTDVREKKPRAGPATAARLRETLPAVLRAAAVRKPCRTPEGTVIWAGENVIERPMSAVTTF